MFEVTKFGANKVVDLKVRSKSYLLISFFVLKWTVLGQGMQQSQICRTKSLLRICLSHCRETKMVNQYSQYNHDPDMGFISHYI